MMGAEMLKESQVIARSALAIGSMIAFGVWYVWPDFPWYTYPLIGLLAVGPAWQPWADAVADEKVVDRRLMKK